jgi:ribosome modulation factor
MPKSQEKRPRTIMSEECNGSIVIALVQPVNAVPGHFLKRRGDEAHQHDYQAGNKGRQHECPRRPNRGNYRADNHQGDRQNSKNSSE